MIVDQEKLRLTCLEKAIETLKEFSPNSKIETSEVGTRVVTVAKIFEAYISSEASNA